MSRNPPRFLGDVSAILQNTYFRNRARIPKPLEDQMSCSPTWGDFGRNKFRYDYKADNTHPLRDLAYEELRRYGALRDVYRQMKAKRQSTGAIEEQMKLALANRARYEAAAADAIYKTLNQDMMAYEYNLHGLHVAEAAATAAKVLDEAILSGDPVAIFIIGHESHRLRSPRVSTRVEKVIQQRGLKFYTSDARYTVHLPKKDVPSLSQLGGFMDSSNASPPLESSRNTSPAGSSGLTTAPAAHSLSASTVREPWTCKQINPKTPRARK